MYPSPAASSEAVAEGVAAGAGGRALVAGWQASPRAPTSAISVRGTVLDVCRIPAITGPRNDAWGMPATCRLGPGATLASAARSGDLVALDGRLVERQTQPRLLGHDELPLL